MMPDARLLRNKLVAALQAASHQAFIAEFEERLVIGVRAALHDLFAAHDEHFYYVALATTAEGHMPILSAWSHEALEREAATHPDPVDARWGMKWSCWEGPYFNVGAPFFGDLKSLLADFPPMTGTQLTDGERCARMEAMTRAFARLDEEGLFGRGADREQIAICVETVPRDDDCIDALTARLNPPAVYAWWIRDMAEATRICTEKWSARQRRQQVLLEHLVSALRAAVRSLFDTHQERFYYLALVTTQDGQLPYLSAWSYEALEREAAKHPDPAAALWSLKWSSPQSPYAHFGAHFFAAVRGHLPDATTTGEHGQLLHLMSLALSQLDREGLFGSGSAREKMFVCAEVDPPLPGGNRPMAKRSNPQSVVRWWQGDLLEAARYKPKRAGRTKRP